MSGSGGGGGYQYQAQATAYIATHILAKQPLHWITHSDPDVPTAVAEETDGPGDDIRITLQNDLVIELQAKHGLKKNEKFWESLIKLTRGLAEDSSLYGVLLADSTASSTIRDELREDIIRLGQGREDNLKAITQEVIDRLREEAILHSSDIFRRFRIVIADLDDSQRDAKTALVLLSQVLQNSEQAGQAWRVLSDDGLDLIKKKGQRSAESLLRLLGRNNIQPSLATALEREIDLQDWQQVCRAMLDRQIQFPTLNDLMAKDGISIEPAKLFVSVELIERKQKQYRRSDVSSAEQGSQLLQPIEEEIVKRFDSEEDFFTQVICKPGISNDYRLVITGEPGAGKTTLLQKIGDRLCQEGMLPIWISLGKNGVLPTFEFLNCLLKENAQPQDIRSSNWEASINALLQTGKVWLLLDGADELTTTDNPLQVIGVQLREAWASQIKVVLTCRLNAWDAYALPEFKVFRTLEFDYQTPIHRYRNQVEAYIHQFFARDGVDPQLGNTLIQQLHLPGKERIRDSVKTPLRLSLLCYVWESGIGELPSTRAELYRLFVDHYYDLQTLKHSEISIDRTKRDTLNLALGEVSKTALDSHSSRFILRKSLIEAISTMGKSDAKGSLFEKAIQLGWLNYIGITAEKPHEPAYAFFHPTFQEYFAALAIDDWDDFLPRNHVDRPTKNRKDECKYRIFEPQWKEVILFWLGRSDVEKNEKEAFIDRLMHFDDGYGDLRLYKGRAYFLAAAGVAEFNYSKKEKIIAQIMQWGFGYFDMEINKRREFFQPIQQGAIFTLSETDQDMAVKALISCIEERLNSPSSLEPLKVLGRVGVGHPVAINFLEHLIQTTEDEYIRQEAIQSLKEVEPKHPYFDSLEVQNILQEMNLIDYFQSLEKKNSRKLIIFISQNYSIELLKHGLTIRWLHSKGLGEINCETLTILLSDLKMHLSVETFKDDLKLFFTCYELLWDCIRIMSYPDFCRAWHSSSSIGANLSVDNGEIKS